MLFEFYEWHEVVAAVTETSAAVSVALTALPSADPASAVLAEPPLDGAVLSDGVGLGLSDGDGEDDGVVLGLPVDGGLDESIGAAGVDDGPVWYGVAVWLHDGEGFAECAGEELGDRDAWPSVVPWPLGPCLAVWEPLPPGAPGA